MNNRHYVVIDLEATCWAPEDPETGVNEIIEIGVVVLSPEKTELWRASHFVRPKLNPILSEFCKELTTIEQHQVDSAETFPVVMNRLEGELHSVLGSPVADSLFVSWGNYDRRQFEKDCALHGYQYPFGEHFNLKEEFTRRHKVRRSGLKTALGVMRLPLLGTHHRGIDDAVNISRILQKMDGV